mmetsp:Transcript_83298/g.210004  ORF Transcript_83298/g.210004 Transcript_83298/m.210004 type:complete len:249 (-) Transcript_83298:344-1090(-)
MERCCVLVAQGSLFEAITLHPRALFATGADSNSEPRASHHVVDDYHENHDLEEAKHDLADFRAEVVCQGLEELRHAHQANHAEQSKHAQDAHDFKGPSHVRGLVKATCHHLHPIERTQGHIDCKPRPQVLLNHMPQSPLNQAVGSRVSGEHREGHIARPEDAAPPWHCLQEPVGGQLEESQRCGDDLVYDEEPANQVPQDPQVRLRFEWHLLSLGAVPPASRAAHARSISEGIVLVDVAVIVFRELED